MPDSVSGEKRVHTVSLPCFCPNERTACDVHNCPRDLPTSVEQRQQCYVCDSGPLDLNTANHECPSGGPDLTSGKGPDHG